MESNLDTPHHNPSNLTDRLTAVLDELVDIDPNTLTDTELHHLVTTLVTTQNRLDAAMGAAVGDWDARRVWNNDGSKSPRARLLRESGWSNARSGHVIARARLLRHLPHARTALAAGTISSDHLDLLRKAKAAETDEMRLHDCEAELVEMFQQFRYKGCKQLVERWIAHADPDDAERRAARNRERRRVNAASTIDGLVHLDGLLDAVGGTAFANELTRLERILHDHDQRTGRIRTAEQRRADALVEMATRSGAMPADARRPAPLFTVLVGVDSFAAICELTNGQQLTPGQLAEHLTSSDIERIIFDGADRILSVSRRRSFTGAVRRAIEVRDQYCTHPSGCDTPAEHGDIDHQHQHSHGGLTSQTNGRALCSTHNRNHTLRNRAPQPTAPRTRRPPRGLVPGLAHTSERRDTIDDDGSSDLEYGF